MRKSFEGSTSKTLVVRLNDGWYISKRYNSGGSGAALTSVYVPDPADSRLKHEDFIDKGEKEQ